MLLLHLTAALCASTGLTTVEQAVLTAEADIQNGALFGGRVAISGDTVATGAYSADIGGVTAAGEVYVFVRSGTTWSRQARLTMSAPEANAHFGSAVAIDGDTLVIGASQQDQVAVNSGAAFVYERNGTTWTQATVLTASDAAQNSAFGNALALDGDVLLIGALNDDGVAGSNTGSAYVFVRSGTTWNEQARLQAGDAEAEDHLGASVAIEASGTALVGAPGEDTNGGAAYVFTRSGTSWSQQARLLTSEPFPNSLNDGFGSAVALQSGTALVSAPDANQPFVLAFIQSGTSWSEQNRLNGGPSFGSALDLQGDVALIGAPQWGATGRAQLFRRSGSQWSTGGSILPSAGANNDSFGIAVALAGNTALCGNCQDDMEGLFNAGSCYVLLLQSDPPTFCNAADGALASCPCGNGGSPESGCDIPQATGGVSLSVVGQDTSPNGATLQGTGYPTMGSPTTIVVRSDALDPSGAVVFGDGVRCINSSPFVRLAAGSAAGGASTHSFGHGAMAAAGSFYYQVWFRSSPSTFCDALSAFNFSSGVSLFWP